MKNKILKILSVYPGDMLRSDFFDADRDSLYLIGELQETIEQLIELMCYREVRAFMNGIIYVNNSISEEEVLDCFMDTYQRERIIKAIEQIKKE